MHRPERATASILVSLASLASLVSGAACGGSGAENTDPKSAEATDDAPLAAVGFYVDPNSNPAIWVKNNGGDSRAASIQTNIATKPMTRWFGNWSDHSSGSKRPATPMANAESPPPPPPERSTQPWPSD